MARFDPSHRFDPSQRSFPQLFTDLFEQFTNLFRKEITLARVELSENVTAAAIGIGLLIAATCLLTPALVILLEAAVAGLNEAGFAPYWSALIVGGAAILVGIILVLIGISRLRVKRLVPSKTIEQLRRDAALAQEEARRTTHVSNQRAA
jgi:Putative Actinobacterial Holin-X, holin superfamily III